MSQTRFASPFHAVGCAQCRGTEALGFAFTMAFQPIVDLTSRTVFAYEALVRGPGEESAASILALVNDQNRYRFDQACRVRAIELASRLRLHDIPDCKLSINFLPNAVYRPETCIRATLEAAQLFDFPLERLMFEVTEVEQIEDPSHLKRIFDEYSKRGFTTAIDDFGAGYSGLNLLASFQPQIIKLDMALTRNIHSDRVRQAIVAGILQVASRLNIEVIAEGIELGEERDVLVNLGVRYMQGFLFAHPGFETLVVPEFP
jgi:EAL domain-containing protein (putative c-di-GMP-specific phosphodiesterase class I)